MGKPDFEGVAGCAWDLIRISGGVVTDLAQTAGLASWVINCPLAHPAWDSYLLGVVHLRDIPGTPEPARHYPGAQYELMISAIDPEAHPAPDPEHERTFKLLAPPNVVEQFHGITDSQAAFIGRQAARAIVEGRISPDSDFQRAWNATIKASVKHFGGGVAPEAPKEPPSPKLVLVKH